MLPRILNPMLAQKAEAPFDSEQHLFEIKWDGIRCLAFIEGGHVRLQSRQLTEMTFQFPELACLKRLPSGTILDGELVVLQEGRPSLRQIQRRTFLQNRARIQGLSQRTPVTYIVFDVLYLKGEPLLAAPLHLRREALKRLIQRTRLPGVLVSEAVAEHGCQLFAQVAGLGLEGIMAKRLDGPYLPGKRSRYWFKIKPRLSPEVLMAATAMANSI
jgi:ATP-dependent DNA ligase